MKSKSTLILISNDDGYQSEGIRSLSHELRKVGQVVVVAPETEQSATSHSLTLHRPLRINLHGENFFSVNGTPTDCITLALHKILKRKPDLIVSGINRGANLCDDVHYSGTVSAAIEGAFSGIPSIAVSLVVYGDDKPYYETAARFAARLSKKVMRESLPKGFVLNVNVPNLKESQLKGYVFTRLGKRNFGDVAVEKIDPRGRKYYWIAGDDRSFHPIPGSDGSLIQKGQIVVTPLQIDMTHYSMLEEIRNWKV